MTKKRLEADPDMQDSLGRRKRKMRYAKKRTIRLAIYADKAVEEIAAKRGITVSHLIRRMVNREVHVYLAAKEKANGKSDDDKI